MVRGPMIADVTPGWAIANAMASWVIGRPASSASGMSLSTTASLRSSAKCPGIPLERWLSVCWPVRYRPVSSPWPSGLQTSVPMP